MVIFSAQVKIAEKDRGFRASDDQNNENQKEESIHVVDLRRPNWVQHEEELDKDASKRQDSAHDNARHRLGINTLLRDLPRDLISAHGMFNGAFAKPEKRAHKSQGYWDAEPQGQ